MENKRFITQHSYYNNPRRAGSYYPKIGEELLKATIKKREPDYRLNIKREPDYRLKIKREDRGAELRERTIKVRRFGCWIICI